MTHSSSGNGSGGVGVGVGGGDEGVDGGNDKEKDDDRAENGGGVESDEKVSVPKTALHLVFCTTSIITAYDAPQTLRHLVEASYALRVLLSSPPAGASSSLATRQHH